MYLEHVNLTVKDLDRSIAFYADLFDLRVRWKGPIDGTRLGAHVGDDRTYLALFEASSAGEIDHDYSRPGVNHFGFVVDDLDDVRGRLGRAGTTVHLEADYEPGRRIYFLDPDGNEIEVVEYPAA